MTDSRTRYQLQKELGAGAMGEVWLATDTLLNRPVAIKYLTATDETLHKEFFLSEARALALLQHPNITLIYDAVLDETENVFYLVMEYVEGQSLANLIEGWSGPMPLDIALDIAIDLLRALQYAHDKGIVHRDIKPGNVIIHKKTTKLTDFGLASLMSLLTENKDDLVVGTPDYMAPEQIVGEPIDGRADLYALGIMLFEMLSGGQTPFAQYHEITELLEAHVNKSPASLRSVNPNVPLALERVVTRLLAKEPDDRYPSAEAVINILTSIRSRQKFSHPYFNLLDLETKPLVNRVDELKQMEEIWAEVQENSTPQLLVVQGPAGIGKSSLIAEFLGKRVLDQGAIALVGRCYESAMPYAPFAELLATIIDQNLIKPGLPQEQLDLLLEHIPGLANLLNLSEVDPAKSRTKSSPELTRPNSGLWQALGSRVPEQTTQKDQPAYPEFFITIFSVLKKLGPTTLFLEDAVFLDQASLMLSQFLIRQQSLPLLAIAAVRKNGKDAAWLDTFSDGEKASINLNPLPAEAIKENLLNLLGGPIDEAFINFVERTSGGNPLQIEEIVHQLSDSDELYRDDAGQWRYVPSENVSDTTNPFLPKSVLDTFVKQIQKLPEENRDALTLATLVEPGNEFDFDVWLALLGGEPQRELAQSTLDEALKIRLLRQINDNRYAFRRSNVRDTLLATLTPAQQRELHRQLAKILHQRQADPLLVGHHYEQAGLATEAAHYMEKAATKAVEVQNIKTAIAYYNRVVTLIKSRSAYKALGDLYRRRGQWADALRALQQAFELAEAANDVLDQAQILNRLSQTLNLYGDYREAYDTAAVMLNLPGISDAERATAQTSLSKSCWLMGRLSEAEHWSQKTIVVLTQNGDDAGLTRAYNSLGTVYVAQGKFKAAQMSFQQAFDLSKTLDIELEQSFSLVGLGQVALEQGQFEAAVSCLNSAKALFDQLNHQAGLVAVYKNLGQMALYQAQPDTALTWLTKALHLALKKSRKASPYELSHLYRLVGEASLRQGEVVRALAATKDALKLVQSAGNQLPVALALSTLAQVYVTKNEQDKASEAYQKSLALLAQIGSRSELCRTQLKYAEFLTQQGHPTEADDLTQKAHNEAEKLGLYIP